MADIRIPKFNSNDSEYVLVEWAVADGSPVRPDDVIATIETSKTAEELVSEHAGVLRHIKSVGDHCAPGEVIGRVSQNGAMEINDLLSSPTTAAASGPVTNAAPEAARGPLVTEPARKLIGQLGVGEAALRALGVKVVREADVRRLAETARNTENTDIEPPRAARRTAAVQALPSSQRAVAQTVTRSHDTIPAAYTAIKVDVGAALEESRNLADALRRLVGLPEFLVFAVASLHPSFPVFFASLLDGDTMRLADAPCVGVTFDVGKGLVVPVVKDAVRLTLAELAEVLCGYRRAAISGSLRQRDLTGGNITVTLHGEPDVSIAIPLVFPGQACALALAGAQQEVALEPGGKAVVHTVANIGLAYDHRLINGRDAIQFLRAVKDILEAPTALTHKEPADRPEPQTEP